MDAYELLSKRNHIHKYKEDKIPPKELIDILLKITTNKNDKKRLKLLKKKATNLN